MDSKALWFLENIDVNGIFCPDKMGEKMPSHDHKIFAKSEYIYLPNDESDKIYLITEGRVKIGNYADSGKEITKAILEKGELFGELAIVGEGKRRDYAYAVEKVEVCCLSLEDVKSLLKDHSSFSIFFMRLIGSRALELEKRLESLVFKDSRSRIVEFLLEMIEKKGQRVGYEWVIRKFLTHQEIANLTATSRQTVTTVLNELRNNEIITFDRKRLLIRDLDKLKAEMDVVN